MNDRQGPDPVPGQPAPIPPPRPAVLAALPSDAWAWLLPHVRAALHDLADAEVTGAVRRLRAAPTSRLAGGRVRHELDAMLTEGGSLWQHVVERVRAADRPPAAVAALLDPRTLSPAPVTAAEATSPADGRDQREERSAARARERSRALRTERDELRRQLDGATARASAAEKERGSLERELAVVREELAQLRAELEDAVAERDRAVEREGRRRESELRELTATVSQLRRDEAERLAARRRREEAEQQQAERARLAATREVAEHRSSGTTRLEPGRPSRLPQDVAPGTTEAAELLLHAGRLVLVDGYNVTKQHRSELDLEGQRTWLVRTLATLAARRRVRPVVVFDGQQAGASRPPSGSREVRVVFTPAGVTADDELVLAVEATDEPVVVVTDDRELSERLRTSGADVVGTRSFLGVTRTA
ncbi:MAG: NYN domain-containing protein [Nitriliruptor sp.]|uniref:NYN domain-containing protein n=1 Tax=Nitriliruptor sp. TaxID=2448056 RepID=UPI0034A06325